MSATKKKTKKTSFVEGIDNAVAEMSKTIARLRSERDGEIAANAQMQAMRTGMYDSLMLEKMDLMGRIGRIDQRIHMLGLQPAPGVQARVDLTKTPGVSR